MKENEPARIRSCDEYEELLEQFLQALMRCKQEELMAALSAVQSHSQQCLLCEETLRVYVNANVENASTAMWSAT